MTQDQGFALVVLHDGDELEKGRVRAYTRHLNGRAITVQPYERRGDQHATGGRLGRTSGDGKRSSGGSGGPRKPRTATPTGSGDSEPDNLPGSDEKQLFQVPCSLGFRVKCSREYWETHVVTRHGEMRGRSADVVDALRRPTFPPEKSQQQEGRWLFYWRKLTSGQWTCAVVDRKSGLLVTAYRTSTIKR